MKFIVSSTYLLRQLQLLGGVIGNNSSLPILENFLFELDGNDLKISASDLETTITGKLQVESNEQAVIALPAKLLLETLKTFPEQPLTFIKKDNNTVEISSNYGDYALAYVSGDEFPEAVNLKESETTAIEASVLSNAISKTLFAAGNDELRPIMSGVFFQFSTEGLTFVATDAHKLVKYHRSDIKANQSAEFIVPKKPLNLLKSMLGAVDAEVTVEYNKSNAKFTFEDIELVCRLIDGKYPNYEAVIPKENPNKLLVQRASFLSSVRRVAIFSNKTTHQIRLKITGAELKISAEDIDYSNKAEERLTCNYNGDDMEIGFNSRFFLEMLNNLDSNEVQLEMSLPNRAGILTPIDGVEEGEYVTMLVMPVTLSN